MKLVTKIKGRIEEEYARLAQLSAEKWHSHSPPVRFAIIGNIRSGSTMLQQLLNSHPNCRCFFELFHRDKSSIPFGVKGYERKRKDSALIELRNQDPVSFLSKIIFGRQPEYIQAVGFKLIYTQCRRGFQFWDAPEYAYWWKEVGAEPKWEEGSEYLWDYLVKEKVHIIHLIRENQLESKVSGLLAQKTGKWGIGATGGFQPASMPGSIHINPREFELDVQGEEHFRAEVRSRFSENPFFETTYEKLISEPGQEHASILHFLGLPDRRLKTATKIQRTYSVEEIVENYHELFR